MAQRRRSCFTFAVPIGMWVSVAAAQAPAPATTSPPVFSDTLEQRLLACSACHGKEGEGSRQNEYFPRIAGKPVGYLYRQLVNFRQGRRTYPQMVYLVRHMSDDYLLEIAQYYEKQKPAFPTPIKPVATSQMLARGEALVRSGDPSKNIPACAACHGKALTGMQPGIPGIIGLYPDYVVSQLGAWRNGSRVAADPDCMAKIALRMSGPDMNAVAIWLAAQPGTPTSVPAPESRQKLPLECGSQAPVTKEVR
jgi:cytochrome c553